MDAWFPMGHKIESGLTLKRPVEGDYSWQIYIAETEERCLIVSRELGESWLKMGILSDIYLKRKKYGADIYYTLDSKAEFILSSLKNTESPANKTDALAFASAIKRTREWQDDFSLHDAIYIEQFSLLLPTWSVTPAYSDDIVLGGWLTGGVHISIHSDRRMQAILSWLSNTDILEIKEASGLIQANQEKSTDTISLVHEDTTPFIKMTSTNEAVESETNEPRKAEKFRLPGRPELESFFQDYVVDIVNNPERYMKLGIEFPTAILLHGPPGCGKTYAAEKLVEFLDWPSFEINSGSVGSSYIHETSKKISKLFDRAIAASPSVLIIDEMESFLTDRSISSTSGTHHIEEVAEFLRQIPQAQKKKVLIIAMTNLIDQIDPAILRKGRFDNQIEIGMPTLKEVQILILELLSKLPTQSSLKTEKIEEMLTGRALSDAAFVVRESARLAAKSGKSAIDQDSLDLALDSLKIVNVKDSEKPAFGFSSN